MPIYKFGKDAIVSAEATTFSDAGLRERQDMQRLLLGTIDVIAPETLVISEEFGDWEDSKRRIDLLAVDKKANLVVIELKRTEDGGHSDLQSIRYAAMVSTMTFEKAVEVFEKYLEKHGPEDHDARTEMLEFLEWEEPYEDRFAQDVRIVIASADFSKEVTSTVLWLNDHGTDISCVRLKPYCLDEALLVDAQQIIPLPEAADFQNQIREKSQTKNRARIRNADYTRFDVEIDGGQFGPLAKRNAIFLVCKFLCDKGTSPHEIAGRCGRTLAGVWYGVDGEVDADAFLHLAAEKAASGGPAFNRHRWYCDDGDLVRTNGNTYAFTKMWGGENWSGAMTALKDAYPQFGIEFTAVD